MESEELKKRIPESSSGYQCVQDLTPQCWIMRLEFLVMSGMELPLAVMIMIPEPWANNSIHVSEEEGFLSVLRNNDGAMGRTGIHRILRW